MSDKRFLGNIITPNPTEPAGPYQDSAASGTWSVQEVFTYVKAGLWPTAGNVKPAIEDMFSTYLYTGNGASQVIENGINLGPSYSGTGSDGSALFGGNGDYVTVSGLSSSVSGDFTIELFGYSTASPAAEKVLLGPWGDATHGSQVLLRFSGETLGLFFPSFEIGLAKSVHGIGRNEWFHLAITRSSGTLRVFANGAQVYSGSYSGTIDLAPLYVGSERSPFTFSGNWEGNISNLRVSTTTAFYTSNFALPSANLTAIAGTSLLTLQGATPFVDNSGNSYTVTAGGSASASSTGAFPVVDGEGGLVWTKSRSDGFWHEFTDTERGPSVYISSNSTGAQNASQQQHVTSFNADGFSVGFESDVNNSGSTYASWTFRKAPRFFDVVTYTGNWTSGTQIAHNLGVTPGCIIVKSLSEVRNWFVYHRSIGATKHLHINTTDAEAVQTDIWNNTEPTDTHFTLGDSSDVNSGAGGGQPYVAYLFAHDPLGPSGDGSDGLIACGSYTGNGLDDGPTVDLGWEPQWVLIKNADDGGASWVLHDTMRGMPVGSTDRYLVPNTSNAEGTLSKPLVQPTPTGFKIAAFNSTWNGNGNTMIYIAIRRGPMRPPESGSEVFDAELFTAGSTVFQPDFPPDMNLHLFNRSVGGGVYTGSRMTGNSAFLVTSSTGAEGSFGGSWKYDGPTGTFAQGLSTGTSSGGIQMMFRRAPEFFDVVAYTGNGVAGRTVPHNLGVAPEMMWVKGRSIEQNWVVYNPNGRLQLLNGLAAEYSAAVTDDYFGNGSTVIAPTEAEFTIGTDSAVNSSGNTYIAYLFATLPGVSKVGSYTGNGSSQTIDCGFTTGARFVLIKRTDSTGDWYVWDSARGIVAGNDPHLSLNTTAAEVTTDDSVDADSSGFIVNQVSATNVNVNAASYIFLAIA